MYLHNAKVSKAAAGSLGYYDEDFNSLSTLDIQGANNTVYVSGVNCVGTLYGFDTLVLTADRETNSEDAVLTLGQTETTREIQTLSNDSLFEGKTLVLRGELEGVNFWKRPRVTVINLRIPCCDTNRHFSKVKSLWTISKFQMTKDWTQVEIS